MRTEINLRPCAMDLPAAWRHYVSPCSYDHEYGMDLHYTHTAPFWPLPSRCSASSTCCTAHTHEP